MASARIQPQEKTYPDRFPARLVRSDELFTAANAWVRTQNPNHIQIDRTVDGPIAHRMRIDCYGSAFTFMARRRTMTMLLPATETA